MFGLFTKSYVFQENYENYQFKFALFCVQGQPGLKIRNQDNPQTHFDTMNPMAISKQASVRNHVSRDKLNCLDLCEITIT